MSGRGLLRALLATLAGVAATPGAATAQEVNLATLEDAAANRLHLRAGAEHGFVAGVGYARAATVLGRRLLLAGGVTAPWAEPDASDYRVRAGVLVPVVGAARWKLAGQLSPTARATRNDVGRMIGLGADLGLVGGYYASRWLLAGEAGFDWSVTTRVTHSDLYRSTVFADARDGWYGNPGGNLRYGVQAGVSFARHDVVLRVGQLREVGGAPPLIPFYGTLTLDTRW